MKVRRPDLAEQFLYEVATDKKAPWCLLIEAPELFWGRWQGITLWKLIIQRDLDREDVVVHEMVHVEQFKNPLVYFKYFYYLWKHGYRKNPYEVEAYEVQRKVKKWIEG